MTMPPPARTIGALAQLACTWEVLARKAGNVCPGREFPDLTVADFLKSAAAIAPVLDRASTQPLGVTILRCIEETRKVVNTNTNLGIVLLLAPLASVPLDWPPFSFWSELERILRETTVEDSRHAYAAIRLANPGGLGTAPEQDIGSEPTLPLREVMRLAADRDGVAKAFATLSTEFGDSYVELLLQQVEAFQNVERGIIEMQLRLLAWTEDSLIRRKRGIREAESVRTFANDVLLAGGLDAPQGRQTFLKFDAFLRADNHARNPGTTADLIAAALFVALRDGSISPETPFEWKDHPFQPAEPGA
jgi:triphosphoribosyl-dephospho-CoA synthase